MAYEHLSSLVEALFTNLLDEDLRKNVEKALKNPTWKQAIMEEMEALEKIEHGT